MCAFLPNSVCFSMYMCTRRYVWMFASSILQILVCRCVLLRIKSCLERPQQLQSPMKSDLYTAICPLPAPAELTVKHTYC